MAIRFDIDFKQPQTLEVPDTEVSLNGHLGGTVLLIHGLTGTPNEMKFLSHYLHRRGYNVLCPRLANHGQPLAILKKSRWEDFYGSVRDAFFRIRNDNPNGAIFAAGLSMGALLALLLGVDFPDQIHGVSCLSPSLFYDGWNTPWTRCFLPLVYLTPLKHIAYYKEEPPYGIKNRILRQRVHEYYRKADIHDLKGLAQYGYPYFPFTLLYQLQRLIKHLTRKLPEVRVPVQLIQAQEDDMTSVRNSQFIHDLIQSPIKELVLLHDSYHIITADLERETVGEKMAAFFNRF